MTQWEWGGGSSANCMHPWRTPRVCWETLENVDKVSENVLPREGTKSGPLFQNGKANSNASRGQAGDDYV